MTLTFNIVDLALLTEEAFSKKYELSEGDYEIVVRGVGVHRILEVLRYLQEKAPTFNMPPKMYDTFMEVIGRSVTYWHMVSENFKPIEDAEIIPVPANRDFPA